MTHVIVLADRLGLDLLPLTDRCPVALLPVAAKPLLVHCIEDIGMAGLRDITLVLSEHADQIKRTVGTGARWGLRIHYFLSRGEEEPQDLLRRITLPSEEPRLVLRGDVLRAPCLKPFLETVCSTGTAACCLSFEDQRVGAVYLPPGSDDAALQCLAWVSAKSLPMAVSAEEIVQDRYHSAMADHRAYHRANLDAACGRIPGLLLPGREVAVGLTVGRHSQVSPRSLRQGTVLVGSNTRIDARAKLQGEVVVSDNVLIDQDADIRDSVILPNTYIGQLVDIHHAIVFGADMLRVDTGAQLHVNDTFLIADLGSHGNVEYLTRPLNRVLGLLLLLLSFPLWPVAFVLAVIQNSRQPLVRHRLRGNRIELNDFGIRQRRMFTVFEWQCRSPVLRYLPWVLGVVSGDIRLVGAMPISETRAADRIEPWQREADRAPAGLIGPSQLLLPPDALEDEIILSDAVYASRRSLWQNLSYVGLGFRKLCSRSAWAR